MVGSLPTTERLPLAPGLFIGHHVLLEATWQKPSDILAMSNAWWAPYNSAAPGIQEASSQAWARLMGVPIVWAANR